MTRSVKIAISIPAATYTAVERTRRRLGKTRSAMVTSVLDEWLRQREMSEADRQYIEGYRRIPEKLDEIEAVAAQAVAAWSPWEPEPPPRAAAVPRRRPRAPRVKRRP